MGEGNKITKLKAKTMSTTNNNPHRPHFPVATLTYNGQLITTAAGEHPEIAARLPGTYLADTTSALGKVAADLTGQKNAKGELGNLTEAQHASLEILHHCLAQARKTARLAFPGQDVKLHQEFQVGVTGKYDLGSFLGRCDIVLASVQNTANLPVLKLKGWTDAETQAFLTARKSFGAGDATQQNAKGGAKTSTTTKNTDAADLYERLLTIQNAADLQWPANDPANAGVRDEFRLNTFPPAGGGGNGQQPTLPAPTPAKA